MILIVLLFRHFLHSSNICYIAISLGKNFNNIIVLLLQEQVCLMLRKIFLPISGEISLETLVHDAINVLYYEH